MKRNAIRNSHERVMRDHDFIVSKTDPKGRITYGNQTFFEFSGFTEKELLGKPHNIIRHPDMPRGAFKLLWGTLQADKECFAYVNNLAKDGSHYWVFANITPDRDAAGNITGYFSVRRKPKAEAISAISDIYQTMLKEEQLAGSRDAADASIAWLNSVLAERKMSYEEFVLSL